MVLRTTDTDFNYNLVKSLENLHKLLILELLPEKEEGAGGWGRGEREGKLI